MNKDNNKFNSEAIETMMKMLISHNDQIKNQAEINNINVKQLEEIRSIHIEMQNIKDEVLESKKDIADSKEIAIKSAELAFKQVQEIKKHVKITDVQAEEMAALVGKKATHFAHILHPEISTNPKEFSKEIGYIRKGLWTIIKRNINGSGSGSYKNIKRVKFDAAMQYINNLTINDYLYHRNFQADKIKPFVFVEPLTEEEVDIRKLIEKSIKDKNDIQYIN